MTRQKMLRRVQDTLEMPSNVNLRYDMRLGAMRVQTHAMTFGSTMRLEDFDAAAGQLAEFRLELRDTLNIIDESFPEIRDGESE